MTEYFKVIHTLNVLLNNPTPRYFTIEKANMYSKNTALEILFITLKTRKQPKCLPTSE